MTDADHKGACPNEALREARHIPSPFAVGDEVRCVGEQTGVRVGIVKRITTFAERQAFHIVECNGQEFGYGTDGLELVRAQRPNEAPTREHHLKCWPFPFQDVKAGRKPFEYRKTKHNYRVGDVLVLQEWEPTTGRYSGDEIRRRVTYVLPGGTFGVPEGYCVMGLEQCPEPAVHVPEWTSRGRCAALLRTFGWLDSDPNFAERVEAVLGAAEGRAAQRIERAPKGVVANGPLELQERLAGVIRRAERAEAALRWIRGAAIEQEAWTIVNKCEDVVSVSPQTSNPTEGSNGHE